MRDRDKIIVLGLVALGLSISSIIFSYYLLNLGTWSWVIGGLVMTLCLLTYASTKRRVSREGKTREGITDDEGFHKKERVFNRTISKPVTGPLWESRIYKLRQGDMLKVEVIGDHEVTTRLLKIGPNSIRTEIDGLHSPSKRWSNIFEIHEDGDHQVVIDSGQPKVTVTVKIGHRANRPNDTLGKDH
jgi:hypothetical protein